MSSDQTCFLSFTRLGLHQFGNAKAQGVTSWSVVPIQSFLWILAITFMKPTVIESLQVSLRVSHCLSYFDLLSSCIFHTNTNHPFTNLHVSRPSLYRQVHLSLPLTIYDLHPASSLTINSYGHTMELFFGFVLFFSLWVQNPESLK